MLAVLGNWADLRSTGNLSRISLTDADEVGLYRGNFSKLTDDHE